LARLSSPFWVWKETLGLDATGSDETVSGRTLTCRNVGTQVSVVTAARGEWLRRGEDGGREAGAIPGRWEGSMYGRRYHPAMVSITVQDGRRSSWASQGSLGHVISLSGEGTIGLGTLSWPRYPIQGGEEGPHGPRGGCLGLVVPLRKGGGSPWASGPPLGLVMPVCTGGIRG